MLNTDKAVVRDYLEKAFNGRNPKILPELVADDFLDHHIPASFPRGPAGISQWLEVAFTPFPDSRIRIEDMVAENGCVSVRYTFIGTHTGDFMGMAATGRRFSINGMAMARLHDGKLVEWWEVNDVASLTRQLENPSP